MSTHPEHAHHPEPRPDDELEASRAPIPDAIATDDSGGTPPPQPPKLEG